MAAAVEAYAEGLLTAGRGVEAVYWYGSWVSGVPTPSSDADLCVLVEADGRRPRDRVPDFLPARFPVPVDVLVLTPEELDGLRERAPSWHRAITSGRRFGRR